MGGSGPRVLFGIDQWQKIQPALSGLRIGLLTHEQAVDSHLVPSFRRLAAEAGAARLRLVALFGPEHGFYGAVQDTLSVGNDRDRHTGLPLYSLFGPQDAPTDDMLADVDVLVCDLVDVGVRFYTYAATMARCLEVCARQRKRMIVLDRPNPLGGNVCEGPQLDPNFRSFLGYLPTPLRHGLTLGELARFYNEFAGLHAALDIVPVQGWQGRLSWPAVGHPWVPPSPNLPTYTSAMLYPGMCLLEGTNLSEGRGTTLPFEMFGAPWIDEYELADALNEAGIPGVYFRPAHFIPTFWKYENEPCGGVQIHVLAPGCKDSAAPAAAVAAGHPTTSASQGRLSPPHDLPIDPLLIGLTVLTTTRRLYPDRFHWRMDASSGRFSLDLLLGNSHTRQDLEAGRSPRDIAEEWRQTGLRFRQEIGSFLLYGPAAPPPLSPPADVELPSSLPEQSSPDNRVLPQTTGECDSR
ncbi:MAG: DUF1343 domain-containing protein [Limnochordaceae bacterium]|nr:DUF1343 domain-containing protein [Limnochordaceae bacterium]